MESYPPLREPEYSNTFATFIAASTEYKEMAMLVKPVIDGFEGKPVKMLSIGAGTGCLETDFINNFGLKLSFYYAIEPSAAHRTKLEKAIASWDKVPHIINPGFFTPEFTTEHCFDFVMMSHALYCMPKWREILGAVHELLAPEGKFCLFHHADKSHPTLEFVKYATINPPPIQDHSITVYDIDEELEARQIKKSITVGPSKMQVHEFMEGKEDGSATHVVDFLLQTSYKNLSQDLKDVIKRCVSKKSSKNADGVYWKDHPTAMVVIEK